MKKYQKKPVTVEAFEWSDDNKQKLPDWLIKMFDDGTVYTDRTTGKIYISTLEGEMLVREGDFIIQGVKGEVYPCKPDIFEETYVKVNDTDRISPDDIGNDIHEFLHGEEK